jgi:uncharacterized protein YaaQ
MALVVAMWLESFGEQLIRNNSNLRESIHASTDFHVDVAIVGNVVEVVGVDNFLW